MIKAVFSSLETHHQAPFSTRDARWETQTCTPWYSMTRRGDWFRVEPTSGRNPVSVLVIDAEDRVLLVEIYRPALDRICIETPRGFVDGGETDRQAAARELKEETGLNVRPSCLIDLGNLAPDSGILSTRVRLFGLRLERAFAEFDAGDGEILSRRLIARPTLEKMIARGEIEDAIVAVSLLRLMASDAIEEPRVLRWIEIVGVDDGVVAEIETDRPDWSFREYARNRSSASLRWRFKL